jgi:hypothetical protein
MTSNLVPESYHAFIKAVDLEIERQRLIIADHRPRIAALDIKQAALGSHPNHTAYCHGGVLAVREMTAQHILPHAGFCRLPYPDAVDRLAEARANGDEDCLISALRTVCESDALLEVAGFAWFDERGLLKRGALNPYWLRRPLLGLGQPAKIAGLAPRHVAAHRGLYTLSPLDLGCRFAAVSKDADEAFGDLLLGVIEAGGDSLAMIGAAAVERDAAERYATDCASFAAHQRTTGDRHWRWKPALSRQGHLAVTTANVRDVDVPAERSRGHAATWLDDNGANPRFREE